MSAKPLDDLFDCSRLVDELHISRKAALGIMARVPKQYVPGLRKVYVRGSDVRRLLDENLVDDVVRAPLPRRLVA